MTLKESILKLKSEDVSLGYRTIASRLNCSEATVRYHLSPARRQAVSRRATAMLRRHKSELVKLKGGQCEGCGYDKVPQILQFHHLNPNEKDFNISDVKSWDRKVEEVKKCKLLCPNCHAEIHEALDSEPDKRAGTVC